MVSKIVTTGARFAAKKIGNKALEKMSDTYDNTKRKVLQNTFGAKPLNVGEQEFIDCLRTTGNRSQCEGVAQKAVKQYRKTGKY